MLRGQLTSIHDFLILKAIKSATSEHLDKFARAGLRTLCFGYRELEPAFYRAWTEKFERANLVRDAYGRLRGNLPRNMRGLKLCA